MSEPNDAEILFPDGTIEIEGEQIEVREFRYLEGLKATAIARPIIAGLRDLIKAEGDLELDAIDALIGEHAEAWVQLISMSTGLDPERIQGLSDRDGMALSMAFWNVAYPFFTRRLVLAEAVARGMAEPSRSPSSSPSSSQQDTDGTQKKSESD